MENTVVHAHHGLQQGVANDSLVLKWLVANNQFDIHAHDNLLFLSSNSDLAVATSTRLHASSHEPIATAQTTILNAYGNRETASGTKYLPVMNANPADLSEADRARLPEIISGAKQLAADLRDYTNKAIVEGRLALTATDAKYAGSDDAIAQWKGEVDSTFQEFNAARQGGTLSQELFEYRQTSLAIQNAGGDVRWRALDSPQKIQSFLDFAISRTDVKVFGTMPTGEGLDTYVRAQGMDPIMLSRFHVQNALRALDGGSDIAITGLLVGGILLLVESTREAMAQQQGVEVSWTAAAQAAGLTQEQFENMGGEAAVTAAVRAATPWGWAKQVLDLFLRGEDVIAGVRLYGHIYPDNKVLKEANKLADYVESAPGYETYKTARDWMVGTVTTGAKVFHLVATGVTYLLYENINPDVAETWARATDSEIDINSAVQLGADPDAPLHTHGSRFQTASGNYVVEWIQTNNGDQVYRRDILMPLGRELRLSSQERTARPLFSIQAQEIHLS